MHTSPLTGCPESESSLMRCFAALASVILIFSTPAVAQKVDSTFAKRNLRQQRFVMDARGAEAPVNPSELRTFMDSLQSAWSATVNGEDTVMAHFNSYVPMWTVRSLMGRPAPQWARCFVWREYAIPAFVADVEYIGSGDPTAEKAFLIRRSNVDWASSPAFDCTLPLEKWNRLYSSFRRLPDLINRYIEEGAYAGEKYREYLQSVVGQTENIKSMLEIVDALNKEESNRAFSLLATAFSEGQHHAYLLPLTKRLAQRFSSREQHSLALATLDMLARYTTEGEVSRDSLRVWYTEVHPERGPERFKQMTGGPDLPTLVPSEEEVRLSGQYRNLTTGEVLDLSRLKGKMVLFDFWATWCGPCIEEVPQLKDFIREYGDEVVLVTVSSDPVTGGKDADGVRQFMEKYGIDYTVLYDDTESALTERFGVAGWPSKFLVNGEGKLLKHPVEDVHTVSLEGVQAYLDEQK